MTYKGILSKWNFFWSFEGNYESSSGLKFCVFIESYMCIAATYQDKRLQELYLMSYSGQDAFDYLFRTARRNVLEYRTLERFGTFRTWRASTSQYSTECGRPCYSAVVWVWCSPDSSDSGDVCAYLVRLRFHCRARRLCRRVRRFCGPGHYRTVR